MAETTFRWIGQGLGIIPYCIQGAFGFPAFYGHNNNAWIDCLGNLGDDDGMSKFVLVPDERLFIHLPEFKDFSEKHPDIATGLLECVAPVNSEYLRRGQIPRLAILPQ